MDIIEAFVTKNRCYQIGTPQPGVYGWKEIQE